MAIREHNKIRLWHEQTLSTNIRESLLSHHFTLLLRGGERDFQCVKLKMTSFSKFYSKKRVKKSSPSGLSNITGNPANISSLSKLHLLDHFTFSSREEEQDFQCVKLKMISFSEFYSKKRVKKSSLSRLSNITGTLLTFPAWANSTY